MMRGGGDDVEIPDDEDIKFGKGELMKTMYLGVNGIIGYQFDFGLNLNGFINQSITETNNDLEEESAGKFNFLSYGVRVGYLFNLKNEKAGVRIKTVL